MHLLHQPGHRGSLRRRYDAECARAREALHSHEAAAAAVKRGSKAAQREASAAQLALDQALEQRRLASTQLSAAGSEAQDTGNFSGKPSVQIRSKIQLKKLKFTIW